MCKSAQLQTFVQVVAAMPFTRTRCEVVLQVAAMILFGSSGKRPVLQVAAAGDANNFPMGTATTACGGYANSKPSSTTYYAKGCEFYVSQGGTLSACRTKCSEVRAWYCMCVRACVYMYAPQARIPQVVDTVYLTRSMLLLPHTRAHAACT